MKKFFLVPLVILLVSAFVFGGCAKEAPAPTPALAPAPAPTLAPVPAPAPAKPVELSFSFPSPPRSFILTDIFTPWAKMIEERTTAIGKPVKIVFYAGGALGKIADHPDMITNGVCDIGASWAPSTNPGRFPLNDVMYLPVMFQAATVLDQVAQELYDTRPEFRNEFAGMKVLCFHAAGNGNLVTRTKQVKTLEDFKGLKCTAEGKIRSDAVSAWGGVPMNITTPEVYTSLERGLLDGGVTTWDGIHLTFKWSEITKYRTAFPRALWTSHLVCAMNPGKFNSLPPDVQKIFDELSGAYLSKFAGEVGDKVELKAFEAMKEYDKKVGNPEPYYMPQDEFQRWIEAVKPIHEKWISETEAKGLPAKSIYEDALRLREKYEQAQ